MKRYDLYKDSGVEWMNEIPSNWEKSRIRMVGDLYGGLTGKKGSDFNDEDNPSNKPFVPFTNIFNNTYISKDHFQYVNVEENENQNRVLKNDLFFLMSSESYEDLGKCSILLEDVEELYLNSFCKGFRIKDSNVNPLFLNYQLLGSLHKEMISVEGNGFTRINLRQDRLLDIPVFIPPLSEQQQIVSFLDNKTSLIDSLIEKTQRKIELLKEKRTSLINEVVTKGLNPNVEMKDSGVEWIGEIPRGWEKKKIGYVSKLFTGNPWKSELFDFENGIKIVRGENVSEGFLRWGSRTRFWVEPVEENSIFYLKDGDIVIGMDGSKVGKNYVRIKEGDLPLLLHQRMCRIRVSQGYSPRFIEYWIGSEMFRFYIDISKTDPMIPHITQKNIFDFQIPFPPLSEQNEIVSYLDEQTHLIDKTISIEEKRIELLKEYRQSLISEVVTGKRKVVE